MNLAKRTKQKPIKVECGPSWNYRNIHFTRRAKAYDKSQRHRVFSWWHEPINVVKPDPRGSTLAKNGQAFLGDNESICRRSFAILVYADHGALYRRIRITPPSRPRAVAE